MRELWKRLLDQYGNYRKLTGVAAVAILGQIAYGVLNLSAVPPYVRSLGWTEYIGYLYAAFMVTEAIFRSPMGTLGDRIGRRSVYIAVGIIGAGAAIVWTAAKLFWLIMIVRIVDGAVSAGIWTATVVTMIGSVAEEQRTTAMGIFIVVMLGGMAVGPSIGGYANDATGSLLTSFYVAAAIFIIFALLAYFFVPRLEISSEEARQPREQKKSLLAGAWFGLKSIPGYIAIACMIYFPIGIIIPIAKLFAMEELGMSETYFGVLFLVGALVLAVVSIGSSKLTALWGKARMVQLGLAIACGGMFVVALSQITWLTIIASGVAGFGFVVSLPAWLSHVSDLAAPEVRGSIMGALGAGQGLGVVAGVLIGGYFYSSVPIHLWVLDLARHYAPFFVSALGLGVGFVLTLLLVREGREPISADEH